MSNTRTAIVNPIRKSKRLVSIKEFLIGKNLRPEEEAGFRAYVNNEKYMSSEGWDRKLTEYKNR